MAHAQTTGRAVGRTAALVAGVVTLTVGLWLTQAAGSDPAPAEGTKSEGRIIGPYDAQDGCEKCHVKELASWQASRHFNSMDLLYKDGEVPARAAGFLKTMREKDPEGISASLDPRMSARCAKCHATTYVRPERDAGLPAWGVSCESCHGPAEHWVHKHSAFKVSGRLTATEKQKAEKPEDRVLRLKEASDHGMVRGDDMLRMARNCLGCHIVGDPGLLNHAGHRSGTVGFDYMWWSQGEVRHNFLVGESNAEASPARRRAMYVVGALAGLESSARAYAKAEQDDSTYASGMKGHLQSFVDRLIEIHKALGEDPMAKRVFDVVKIVYDPTEEEDDFGDVVVKGFSDEVRAGNAAGMNALADQIATQSSALAGDLLTALGSGDDASFLAGLTETIKTKAGEASRGEPHSGNK